MLKHLNKALEPYNVELVKGEGYFYFSDVGDEYVAHNIPSVYVNSVRSLNMNQWIEHVEDAIDI